MPPARLLDRNVRPAQAYEDDEDVSLSEDQESDATSLEEDGSALSAAENDGDDGGVVLDDDENGADEDFQQKVSTISFGALKQAQDSLSRKRKRGSGTSVDQDVKLEALRARLREIRDSKTSSAARNRTEATSRSSTTAKKRKVANDQNTIESEDGSDTTPSEGEPDSHARSSKHAPTAQSSRFQVTRRRNVVEVPKRIERDPRFDTLRNRSAMRPEQIEKAYGFLTEYQMSEIEGLKNALKSTKDADEKQSLRSQIVAMENRLKAKEAKQREREVVSRHRKAERERVQQGKQPYYLKRSEIKQQALVEKFKNMKSKDREKLMERRRKKEGQREKKRMPLMRRTVP